MPARRPFFGNVARVFSFQWSKVGLVILSAVLTVAYASQHPASRHNFEVACDGIEIGMTTTVAEARFKSPPARWLHAGTRHRWWQTYALSSTQDVCDLEVDENQKVVSVKYEREKKL